MVSAAELGEEGELEREASMVSAAELVEVVVRRKRGRPLTKGKNAAGGLTKGKNAALGVGGEGVRSKPHIMHVVRPASLDVPGTIVQSQRALCRWKLR